jgi:TonB family protein
VPNNPNLGGQVTLNFTIQSSGAITGIGTSESTLHHAGVESCLQNTVQSAQFAKINGTCTVKWPLTFNQK